MDGRRIDKSGSVNIRQRYSLNWTNGSAAGQQFGADRRGSDGSYDGQRQFFCREAQIDGPIGVPYADYRDSSHTKGKTQVRIPAKATALVLPEGTLPIDWSHTLC